MKRARNTLKTVVFDGSGRHLEPAAVKLVTYLMSRAGQVCLRTECAQAMGSAEGRSVDTELVAIRRSLSADQEQRLITVHGRGYIWVGERVQLQAAASQFRGTIRPKVTSSGMERLAIRSREEVAAVCHITVPEVVRLERTALAKLSKKPEAKALWKEFQHTRRPASYDPFHKMWLYSVDSGGQGRAQAQ